MSRCPGCGLELPRDDQPYDRKFHASAECWSVFEKVLALEFQSPALFGEVHQLTVDAYAVQHAGGRHPDKSVCVHLVGLYLVLERGLPPVRVAPILQQVASRSAWPRLDPPEKPGSITVLHVSEADSPQTHAFRVRRWAESVWEAWSAHHDVVRRLAADR